jgi:hypothetical protein
MPWMREIEKARTAAKAQVSDPWRFPLERLRGQTGGDGVERISTQLVLDILEVPQEDRRAGTYRRLAKLMAELGWSAVRVRGLTRGGYLECVRGFSRVAKHGHSSAPAVGRAHSPLLRQPAAARQDTA